MHGRVVPAGAIRGIGPFVALGRDTTTAATRGVLIRVGGLVAGRLVENDLETGQGGESGWREGPQRLEGAGVRVEDDE